jgi:hypothetical protein
MPIGGEFTSHNDTLALLTLLTFILWLLRFYCVGIPQDYLLVCRPKKIFGELGERAELPLINIHRITKQSQKIIYSTECFVFRKLREEEEIGTISDNDDAKSFSKYHLMASNPERLRHFAFFSFLFKFNDSF